MTDQPFDPETFGDLRVITDGIGAEGLARQCATFRRAFGAVPFFPYGPDRYVTVDAWLAGELVFEPLADDEVSDFAWSSRAGCWIPLATTAAYHARVVPTPVSKPSAASGSSSEPSARLSATEVRERSRLSAQRYRDRLKAELDDDAD